MTKDIVTLHIYTKHGTYSIPNVDLEKYQHHFEPGADNNPCLQIINESFGVLSITWSEVTLIEAARPVKPETLSSAMPIEQIQALWQSAA